MDIQQLINLIIYTSIVLKMTLYHVIMYQKQNLVQFMQNGLKIIENKSFALNNRKMNIQDSENSNNKRKAVGNMQVPNLMLNHS